MPVGYLITVVVVALFVGGAVAPIRRPLAAARATWFFGIVPNELPFVVCAFLGLSTVLVFLEGDVDSVVGRVAVGIAGVTALGLAIIVKRGLRAGPAVERALREGLGIVAQRHRLPWTRILLAPFSVARLDVERIADIKYGDAGERNLLDLYRPRSTAPSGLTLIHLHGGGFRSGRKNREARPLIYRLASRGWVCISANYRLLPEARFPDQLVDVKRVIAWVRAHGQEYGPDPTMVFVSGSSAGGNLAALAALTPNDPAFQPGFEQTDTSVTAAISLYGYYGRIDDAQPSSSPAAHGNPQAVPFFVAHGDLDSYVLVEGAREFVSELRRTSSNPVVYAELPGGQHAFDLFHSIRFEHVIDGVESFVTWVASREHPAR